MGLKLEESRWPPSQTQRSCRRPRRTARRLSHLANGAVGPEPAVCSCRAKGNTTERKFAVKRFFIVAGAVVTLAVPSAAVAAPDYDNWALKDNTTYDQKNLVGRYSSRIKFDGIAVSGQ